MKTWQGRWAFAGRGGDTAIHFGRDQKAGAGDAEGYRAKMVSVPEVAVTEETIANGGREMVIRLLSAC